ncbi:unnamed protein product [Ambrosiozyma monospora]|uniref:Unnamed protein product n=1 Tax=Ambrosiozyma monospora TaxID=43982 RepID=A0ACB5SRI6_AMBMO|nr:unnamed protein product [Ambrosiozyma monospora]
MTPSISEQASLSSLPPPAPSASPLSSDPPVPSPTSSRTSSTTSELTTSTAATQEDIHDDNSIRLIEILELPPPSYQSQLHAIPLKQLINESTATTQIPPCMQPDHIMIPDETPIEVREIEADCPTLENLVHFELYWGKLSYLLLMHGFEQTIEYTRFKTTLPLYNPMEEKVVDLILQGTINPELYQSGLSKSAEYTSKPVGIIVNLLDDCREKRALETTRIQLELSHLRVGFHGRKKFFKTYYQYEQEIKDKCLTNTIPKVELLRLCYLDLKASGGVYLAWANSYERMNCVSAETAWATFDSLDELESCVPSGVFSSLCYNHSVLSLVIIIASVLCVLGIVAFVAYIMCATQSHCST